DSLRPVVLRYRARASAGQRRPGRSQSRLFDSLPGMTSMSSSVPSAAACNLRPEGLYDPAFEHDACGVAFVVDMHGRRSHQMVQRGLASLCALDHRGATGAEANVGDGAGILI